MSDTGLPELPEGYFWRVTQGFPGIYPWVELRKKYWIGSGCVEASWTPDEFPTVEEEIVWLAGRIKERFDERNYRDSTREILMGDYPPRRLGDA